MKKTCNNCVFTEVRVGIDPTSDAVCTKAYQAPCACDRWKPCTEAQRARQAVLEQADRLEPFSEKAFAWINNSCYNGSKFAEAIAHLFGHQHRFLQAEMIMFLIRILKCIAENAEETGTDQRNEYAIRWARKASDYGNEYFFDKQKRTVDVDSDRVVNRIENALIEAGCGKKPRTIRITRMIVESLREEASGE